MVKNNHEPAEKTSVVGDGPCFSSSPNLYPLFGLVLYMSALNSLIRNPQLIIMRFSKIVNNDTESLMNLGCPIFFPNGSSSAVSPRLCRWIDKTTTPIRPGNPTMDPCNISFSSISPANSTSISFDCQKVTVVVGSMFHVIQLYSDYIRWSSQKMFLWEFPVYYLYFLITYESP